MKSKWFLSLFAAAPLIMAMLVLQSCGGEGGPVGAVGGDDDSSITKQFLALLPAGQADAKEVGAETCGNCHSTRDSEDGPYTTWLETKHHAVGVGCEKCHGPGSAHAANPSENNILNGPKAVSPVVCGQCHGPKIDQFHASPHPEIIVHPVEDGEVNPNQYGRSSRCMTCHSGWYHHETVEKGVNPVNLTDDEIIHLAHQAVEEAPYSATCVNCHNPHANTENLSAEGKQYMLRRPVTQLDVAEIGPGTSAAVFTEFKHLCGQCHNARGADASDARLATSSSTSRPNHHSNQFNVLAGISASEGGGPVVRNNAHFSAEGQCTKCHLGDGNHTFMVKVDSGCAPCHSANDATQRLTVMKSETINKAYALKSILQAWSQEKFGDPDLWDFTSTITGLGKTPPNQSQIPIEVRRARWNYYYVIYDGSLGVHNPPYTRHVLQVAQENVESLMTKATTGTSTGGNLTTEQKLKVLLADKKRGALASMDE